ncbi:MAG: sensor histidine kinase [Chloroflexi bacterium]|nr:MAG: sensor histidine kinase [Chloroflexota bacterium]
MELLSHQISRPPSSSSTQATRPIAPENADVVLSISQELRTPMSSIMGYTDLLLSESVGILGALQRQFLQRVQANIDRLNHLIQDLVSVTALDSDSLKLQPATVDMLEVIEDAITSAGNQFREKSITLHMNLPDRVPPLRADRDAMYQVMMQLLSNAYLASPQNGEVSISACYKPGLIPPVGSPSVAAGQPVDAIYVTVTDQGGGVPPDEQRRVFGRLYRADNPLIEGLGDTGVGLSIAKTLVEAHGGAIWLESQIGKGSTFQFILPLLPQRKPAQEVQ